MDLSATIRYLGELLGTVIGEQESPALFELEERIRSDAKAFRSMDMDAKARLSRQVADLTIDASRAVAQAFTLYFDLVNIAEEAERARALRERLAAQYPEPVDESITAAIATLKRDHVPDERVQELVNRLDIELVLTAHPTEAKRRTILSKLARISQHVNTIYNDNLTQHKRAVLERALLAEITSLWLTHRSRTNKPSVTDEVRTGLYFIENVFWTVLPGIYLELETALKQHYPGTKLPDRWFSLASWMGGDRDGNPNVTSQITAETLRLHRGLAVERHRASLQDLSRRLSMDARRLPPPAVLQDWIDQRRPLPAHAFFLETRYMTEPYRLVLALVAADLANASEEDMTARLLENKPHQARIILPEVTFPLDAITAALPERIAADHLKTVRQQVHIFGLHAARLDLREESSRLARALGEVLRGMNLAPSFELETDLERTRILVRLLREYPTRPAELAERPGVTAETAETWELFRLIARVQEVYGRELLGPFIISMTRGPSDVLTVLLLAKWCGCDQGLDVVPLLETLEDLDSAARILTELFGTVPYRAHLSRRGDHQTVMIGYSDSNKDAGYLAANWALYQAQESCARVCRESGIKLTLFHGRGGTIARGGGPANRAIRAQPPGTIDGRFRLTEQGETIGARYSNPDLAHRHLEQIVNAVILASLSDDAAHLPQPSFRQAISEMAERAYGAYRALVYDTPGFVEFWRSATPIEEITSLTIGSRPSSRGGADLRVRSMRAIPWVFSWMQARFNLPGWYGLGAALEDKCASVGGLPLLQRMYNEWEFFRTLLDNAEMSLLKADMQIASIYVGLVPDATLAETIFRQICTESGRTRTAILEITGHKELMEADPIIQRSVQLRNPYVDPLNYIQVETLKRLRELSDQNSSTAEDLREVLHITINGIASGLRNTG